VAVVRKPNQGDAPAMPAGTPDHHGAAVITEQPPLAYWAASWAVTGCAASTARLLWQRRLHLPRGQVGMRLRFADGTSARVYRETVVGRHATGDPCVLVVGFRLRAVRGWGHAAFRAESLLNTPLFAGFPGLVSKLWLADDQRGRYRGLYEWDGPARAEAYARALWRSSRWCRCLVRSTMLCCPGCAVTNCWRGRRSWPARRRMRRPGGAWPRSHDGPGRILVAGAGPGGLALTL
jgi:hypothetical protein